SPRIACALGLSLHAMRRKLRKLVYVPWVTTTVSSPLSDQLRLSCAGHTLCVGIAGPAARAHQGSLIPYCLRRGLSGCDLVGADRVGMAGCLDRQRAVADGRSLWGRLHRCAA